ncbi:MAG: hypothetical protein O2999_14915 [Nitrospirae bacterium]|nr:hypothetical protein [Nitrospirota bacterium]MDA1305552.1 hypothetical protein [Nitrospirota bacterium]
MAEIHVQRLSDEQFRVEVREGASSTIHTVTAAPGDLQKYGAGVQPETLIEKSFEFLLERESKESILRSFDLPLIAQYFPEYPQIISSRLV